GTMVQIGWNTGPRHARVFGLAKSYTRNLDHHTAIDHDQDVIAAMTLTWSLAKSLLPIEMIAEVTAAVRETGLPKMVTRNISEGRQNSVLLLHQFFIATVGTGYRMSVDDKDYDFPLYDRAPCEGILTQNYSSCVDLLLYLFRS
ncbi:hypothetical protein K438DRAFT_1611016, partial [Mycena galopus ATCC 62051]